MAPVVAALPTIASVLAAASTAQQLLSPRGGGAAPAPPKPIAAPTIDTAAVQQAKQKSMAAMQAQQGRQSTILSDKLGG